MANLWVKKPLALLLGESEGETSGLKRTLTATHLVLLGIGAIIGAGLFVRTAAAASEAAGPAVTLSFVFAAIGCVFAGLCYAEFASMFPIAGSAYTYAYVTMGELMAWVIGWALIMEYALGAATVSIAWSEYLNKLFEQFGGSGIPYEWCHSPFEKLVSRVQEDGSTVMASVTNMLPSDTLVSSGFFNGPALIILALLTLLLIRGTHESAFVNAIIVFLKVAIVLIFIILGFQFINVENYTPYLIPEGVPGNEGFFEHGWGGIIGGAGIVFFAFIGFDAVSTAAQEAKNPKRDMPIGILGSLAICTVLYILFSYVLTGVANWSEFKTAGKEASVAYAIETYMHGYGWLAKAVTIAILAGFSSVILVMLMGQSRVFFSMSNDGLLPKAFSSIHPKFRTPYKANMILFVLVGLFAAFAPGSVAGDLTSFGTLLAFVLVCVAVLILRNQNPTLHRPFKTPWVPFVPLAGIAVCGLMIFGLDNFTLMVAFFWMLLGLTLYFVYGSKNSKLQKKQ